MDVAHHSPQPRGTWGMTFIAGLVAGGVIGWLAHTLLPMKTWRVPKRQVNPIQVQKHLKEVKYPIGKQGFLGRAQAEGADVQVLAT